MLAQQRDNDAGQENDNNSNGVSFNLGAPFSLILPTQQSEERREGGRERDTTPQRSTPTPPPSPPRETQPNSGFDSTDNQGRSPPRATTDNTAPARTHLDGNNRRSRSVENEGDEQRRLRSLRITIPPTRTENVQPKKRRRRYY